MSEREVIFLILPYCKICYTFLYIFLLKRDEWAERVYEFSFVFSSTTFRNVSFFVHFFIHFFFWRKRFNVGRAALRVFLFIFIFVFFSLCGFYIFFFLLHNLLVSESVKKIHKVSGRVIPRKQRINLCAFTILSIFPWKSFFLRLDCFYFHDEAREKEKKKHRYQQSYDKLIQK